MKITVTLLSLVALGFGSNASCALNSYKYSSGGIQVTGDFNGDQYLDLAIVNPGYNTISIVLGRGDGTFNSNPNMYQTGLQPGAVISGDFNADGKLDLAVVNSGTSSVSILLGNGNGTFNTQSTYSVGANPQAISLGDFNGDGKLDLAVVNSGTTVSILLGVGNGTFGVQNTYTIGQGHAAGGIAVGDFNNDSKLDLAVVNTDDSTVSVLLGNGNGTFASQTPYVVGSGISTTGDIAIGDLDNNGYLDMVVVNSNVCTLSVLYGSSNGFTNQIGFGIGDSSSGGGLVIADFNGDGKLDLAAINPGYGTISVLLSDQTGRFNAQVQYKTNPFPRAVAVGDFNGDGLMDLTVVSNSSSIRVLFGNENGAFYPKRPSYSFARP